MEERFDSDTRHGLNLTHKHTVLGKVVTAETTLKEPHCTKAIDSPTLASILQSIRARARLSQASNKYLSVYTLKPNPNPNPKHQAILPELL